jgi:hypothetical protein
VALGPMRRVFCSQCQTINKVELFASKILCGNCHTHWMRDNTGPQYFIGLIEAILLVLFVLIGSPLMLSFLVLIMIIALIIYALYSILVAKWKRSD